ncbi:trypco2 family protein [Streptomyces sp. TRM76323]|uniref:Trypco2 family protein n=1 Tax=Streptomyces tamarix TaxID=3078565 RepID=A0ABU3QJ89_9ACTN|nr:trypco2 family protein [Streptomyces tamarix]MDT9682806.1 trypco2 family protein [Streptomyces tamarix]
MDIGLGDAVAALRDDLMEAVRRGEGREVTFDVGPIEMEFLVELRQEARAKAGFRAWVVTADAEGAAARGRSHRIMVTLTPRRGGGPVRISAQDRDLPGGEAPEDEVRARRAR